MLSQLNEMYEKQDMLTKLTSNEFIHNYGYSEIHCISAIGKLANPNVTKISQALRMTRGAISKITKKQIAAGLIESYTLDSNLKEVYFRLTEDGQKIFKEHEKRHNAWKRRDKKFLEQHDEETLATVSEFLDSYNEYLENQIEKLTKTEKK